MSQNSKELLRKSAKQVLTARSDPIKSVVNTATILNTIRERRKNLPRTAKSSLPVIIPDPQKSEYDKIKYEYKLKTVLLSYTIYVLQN